MIAVNNLGGIRKLILGDIPNPKCAITEHDPAWCMAEAAARSFAPGPLGKACVLLRLLLVNYPSKHSISTLVNSLKGVSSRMLRLERPDLRRRYCKGVLRSPSYFAASCGGAPMGILKAYIEQQKTPL